MSGESTRDQLAKKFAMTYEYDQPYYVMVGFLAGWDAFGEQLLRPDIIDAAIRALHKGYWAQSTLADSSPIELLDDDQEYFGRPPDMVRAVLSEAVRVITEGETK